MSQIHSFSITLAKVPPVNTLIKLLKQAALYSVFFCRISLQNKSESSLLFITHCRMFLGQRLHYGAYVHYSTWDSPKYKCNHFFFSSSYLSAPSTVKVSPLVLLALSSPLVQCTHVCHLRVFILSLHLGILCSVYFTVYLCLCSVYFTVYCLCSVLFVWSLLHQFCTVSLGTSKGAFLNKMYYYYYSRELFLSFPFCINVEI